MDGAEPRDEELNRLVEEISASRRYRRVSPELVRRIGSQELARRRKYQEAVRSTRSKLHQVGAAYQETPIDYPQWMEKLSRLKQPASLEALKPFCREMMEFHASTRERLEILDTFFQQTLQKISPVRSIYDAGCGLTPLCIPWMPLAADATYKGCDIYEDMVAFLNHFLPFAGLKGQFQTGDLMLSLPSEPVQVAFFLKMLPCLEQVDRHSASQALELIPAEYILVSYPLQSLGGRRKGMLRFYERHFVSLAGKKGWDFERFEFSSELAFLIKTGRMNTVEKPPVFT